MLIDVIDKGQFRPARRQLQNTRRCFEIGGADQKSARATNCGIRHVTVPIATRILIANVRHIGLSNVCVINLVYFKMQV